MHDASGRMRKIVIFSEHRDTLNYLHAKIAGVVYSADRTLQSLDLGRPESAFRSGTISRAHSFVAAVRVLAAARCRVALLAKRTLSLRLNVMCTPQISALSNHNTESVRTTKSDLSPAHSTRILQKSGVIEDGLVGIGHRERSDRRPVGPRRRRKRRICDNGARRGLVAGG